MHLKERSNFIETFVKRIFVVILSILYITSTTGATLHMHYCMGKLADWGLGHKSSEKCSKCGMVKKNKKGNDCCKDEHKFLKNDADQKTAETVSRLITVLWVAVPASFVEMSFNDFTSLTVENPASNAPPRSMGTAIYIRNCTFLI